MATVLQQLAIKISAETAEFIKGVKSVEQQFNTFTSGLKTIAASVATAFSAQAIASFTLEVSKLAGEAEGVTAAFNKLPESQKLMSQLKGATSGTVSELELMRRSVQAFNFGIDLKALPDLLKFAAIRAQQTGQSVDYLVDSIVTGIGRKSPLILDNLGISAVRLKEKFHGASLEAQNIGDVAKAVGAIASEELQKMGEFSENAATKMARLSASWENLKVALGKAANNTGASKLLDILTRTANLAAGDELTIGLVKLQNTLDNGLGGKAVEDVARLIAKGIDFNLTVQQIQTAVGATADEAERIAKAIEKAKNRAVELKAASTVGEVDPESGLPTSGGKAFDSSSIQKPIETLDTLDKKLKELQQTLRDTDITDLMKLKQTDRDIEMLQRRIQQLLNLIAGVRPEKAGASKILLNDAGSVQGGDMGTSLFGIDEAALRESTDAYIKNIGRVYNAQKGFVSDSKEVWADFSGTISGALSDVSFAFGEAAAGVGNFGDAIIKALIGFAKQMGEILIASGVAALAAKKLITNPYGAIIAGAALVAIAGFASASLNRSQSSFNAGGSGAGSSSTQFATNTGIANSTAERINFTFRIEGTTLVAVIDKTKKEQGRLIGSGS